MPPFARHTTASSRFAFLLTSLALLWSGPSPAYVQTNLVSDLPALALTTDPNLQNPWGLASSPSGPFWVAANGSGLATIYNTAGSKLGLEVSVPPAPGGTPPAAPTGQVFNGTSDFQLANGNAAVFIFSTEDGTIAAWNGGTSAQLMADRSASGAIYKGLAIGNNGSGNFLYATNFNAGTIDVFDSHFAPVTLPGNLTDPNLPAGYAPFGIQVINGLLYVTYAQQDADKEDDVRGPGHGFIDVFDLNGNLLRRLASGGTLDSPWGMTLAPAGFGPFANDLLVGNFGDGRINVFDPASDALLGQLSDSAGAPIAIEGLWGLIKGNGGNGGSSDAVYFSAGIAGPDAIEDHGLFGSLSVPEPATLPLVALAGMIGWARRGPSLRRAAAQSGDRRQRR